MTEEFLSFLWRYQLFNTDQLLVDGGRVEVIHPGELNPHAGPDFFNSKIKIGDTLWAGNVEIHLKASDWYRHNHDKNAAFDNVILHITADDDQPVYSSKGRKIATATLNVNTTHLANYRALVENTKWISCADYLPDVEHIIITSLLGKMGIERLEQHATQVTSLLDKSVNNWDEAFFWQVARSYGFHVNSQPFEALARSIPYQVIRKHAGNTTQLEALLFGQAGFLQDDYSTDDYYLTLRKEYEFLKVKYSLRPIQVHTWKFLRLRPANFPTIRIAQLAGLLSRNTSLFAEVLGATNTTALYKLFSSEVSEYWRNHYTFGNPSPSASKALGKHSAQIIMINVMAPFYFIYGKKLGLPQFEDRAIQILEEIEAEDNSVIKQWKSHGIKAKNAFDSQSLLHLKNEYCDKKRCLDCSIGVKIIGKEQRK